MGSHRFDDVRNRKSNKRLVRETHTEKPRKTEEEEGKGSTGWEQGMQPEGGALPTPRSLDLRSPSSSCLFCSFLLFFSNEYPKLFAMLWKRLTDVEHVMHVQKALILVEYLLRYGSERFITDAKRRARDVAALQRYKHYDENNQDDAKEARAKAKHVHELLSDERVLQEERSKASKLRENMRGFGSEYGHGGAEYGRSSQYGGGGRERYGDDEDRYGGRGDGGDRYGDRERADRDEQRAPAPRQQRQQQQQQHEEDPYESQAAAKKSSPPAAAADDEEAAEKERKRKKKERKERERAAEAAAAAASGAQAEAPRKSKSRGDENGEDPFSSSVIPAGLAAGGGGSAAATAEAEKKKKKKEKEKEKAAAPPANSAAQQYAAVASQQQQRPPPVQASSDVDLSAFADSNRSSAQPGRAGSDFDFLSGTGAHAPGSSDLVNMFQHTTIGESGPTIWDQHQQHREGASGSDSFGFDEPAAAAPTSGSSGTKKDTWASDLFNVDNIKGVAPAQQKKDSVVSGGVSMAMMKTMNPNQVPTPKKANQSNGSGGFAGGFGAPPTGPYGAPPPALGPGMGYPGAGVHPMARGGYPGPAAAGGFPGPAPQAGFGAPYGAPQQGYGAPMGYGAPAGYPGAGAPGYGVPGGYGAAAGGFPGGAPQGYGAPGGFPAAAARGGRAPAAPLDPFASLTAGRMGAPAAAQKSDPFFNVSAGRR
jgi:hypothetical protein